MTWSDARATWQLLGEHERKALAYLATYRGHVVTPSELSRHLGTSWQKAAVTAGELRKLGLVTVTSMPKQTNYQITGQGDAAVAAGKEEVMSKPLEGYIVPDKDDEPNAVTCENGCPDGATGEHKISCRWAGGPLFVDAEQVKVLGECQARDEVCIQFTATGEHRHVTEGDVNWTRYPDVEVQLTGHDNNIGAVMGTVTAALRRAGHSDAQAGFRADIFAAESYDDALQRVMQWVDVS